MTNDIGNTNAGGSGGRYNRVSQSPGRSVNTASTNPDAPLGIKILAGLGTLFNLLAILIAFSLFQYGAAGVVGGLVVMGIAVAHIYVLIELVRMKSWAYGAAMILYGLNGLIQLLTVNLIGLVVTALIMAYLWTKAGLY